VGQRPGENWEKNGEQGRARKSVLVEGRSGSTRMKTAAKGLGNGKQAKKKREKTKRRDRQT